MYQDMLEAVIDGNLKKLKDCHNDGGDIHHNNDELLLNATYHGYYDIVEYLLEQGLDVHVQNDKPLYYAAELGYVNIIKLLFQYDADIHAEEDTALRFAVFHDQYESIQILLEHKANIHAGKEEPLRMACDTNLPKTVKLLLDYEADRSIISQEDFTYYKKKGFNEVIDILENYFPIKKVENLKVYNTDGRTTCYKCGKPLKIVMGFAGGNLNYCPECEG
jgi:ankyrin repeat protein